MINVTTLATRDDFGQKRNFFPLDFTGNEGRLIDARQYKMLTELILRKSDEKERELFLSQMDGMSYDDVEDLLFSLLSNTW